MSSILSVRTNVPSLFAQSQIKNSANSLAQSTERLSSGLRINHAWDDAATVAVSSQVQADAKVASSSVTNLNDGSKYLATAEEAVRALKDILSSMNELAKRSSTGTNTKASRDSLNDEFQALATEYNRIVNDTEYNYSDIFTSTNSQIVEEAGYGQNGKVTANLTGNYTDVVGTMTYGSGTTYTGGTDVSGLVLEDFNNDGYADLVTSSATENKLYIQLGNGDGSFKANTSYAAATLASAAGVTTGDFNGDGQLDALVVGSGKVYAFLGNGDGSFQAGKNYNTLSATANYAAVGDFNEDGIDDVATSKSTAYILLLGNGAGSFNAPVTIVDTLGSTWDVQALDLNNDGHLDLISTTSANEVYVALGNGNGTFSVARSYTPYNSATLGRPAFGDLNNDGYLDVVTGDGSGTNFSVMLNNGAGGFNAYTAYASNAFRSAQLVDINGDGNLDMVATGSSGTSIITRVGNGDGTFKATNNQPNGQTGTINAVADLNGDFVPDLVYGGTGAGAYVSLSPTTTGTYNHRVQTLKTMSIATQTGAYAADHTTEQQNIYLDVIDAQINAGASRFNYANSLNNEKAAILNDSFNQMTEVDVGSEAENLVRAQLKQQGAQIVYQAADQQQTLVGNLIKGVTA